MTRIQSRPTDPAHPSLQSNTQFTRLNNEPSNTPVTMIYAHSDDFDLSAPWFCNFARLVNFVQFCNNLSFWPLWQSRTILHASHILIIFALSYHLDDSDDFEPFLWFAHILLISSIFAIPIHAVLLLGYWLCILASMQCWAHFGIILESNPTS